MENHLLKLLSMFNVRLIHFVIMPDGVIRSMETQYQPVSVGSSIVIGCEFSSFYLFIQLDFFDFACIDGNSLAVTYKEPVGVVGQIIPWNYPLVMVSTKNYVLFATLKDYLYYYS